MLNTTVERSAWVKLLFWALAIFVSVAIGVNGHAIQLPSLAALIVFFISLAITFVRGTDGLVLVIFAMLFSPEIGGGLGARSTGGEGGGGVVLRLEDLIMFAVVLGWLLRSAYRGRHFGIIKTPVNAAIWIYMAASIVATLLGLIIGSVGSFTGGFFNNLKYFEYFLLFFMILAHVRSREEIKRMIWALFLVFFLAMIYGYTQLGSGNRICAPFDKEPNTFGGYMVLIMSLAGGIALYDQRAKVRVPLILLILFAIPPLLFTLSRASYLAFLVSLIAFLMISTHRILIGSIAAALTCSMLLGMPLFPERVKERVAGTFEREREYHVQVAGIDFDASASARIGSYQQALDLWVKRPIFGYGVTGTHFIDGQYPRLLAETGVVGLGAFLLVYWRLLFRVRRVYLDLNDDPFLKGAAMGFYCGIIAMLGHAISANTFIIVRIAEPFWLIAGLILLLPVLPVSGSQETEKQTTPTSLLAPTP